MTTSDAGRTNEGVITETYFSPSTTPAGATLLGGSMIVLSDTSISGEDTGRERSKTAPCRSASNGQTRNASEQFPPPAQTPTPSRHTYPAPTPSDSASPSLPMLLESTEPVLTDSPRSMAPCELQDNDTGSEEIGGRNGVQPGCGLPNRHLSTTSSGYGELRPNAMPPISSVGSLPIDGEDVPGSDGWADQHWGHHGLFSEAPPAGGANSRSDVSRRTC